MVIPQKLIQESRSKICDIKTLYWDKKQVKNQEYNHPNDFAFDCTPILYGNYREKEYEINFKNMNITIITDIAKPRMKYNCFSLLKDEKDEEIFDKISKRSTIWIDDLLQDEYYNRKNISKNTFVMEYAMSTNIFKENEIKKIKFKNKGCPPMYYIQSDTCIPCEEGSYSLNFNSMNCTKCEGKCDKNLLVKNDNVIFLSKEKKWVSFENGTIKAVYCPQCRESKISYNTISHELEVYNMCPEKYEQNKSFCGECIGELFAGECRKCDQNFNFQAFVLYLGYYFLQFLSTLIISYVLLLNLYKHRVIMTEKYDAEIKIKEASTIAAIMYTFCRLISQTIIFQDINKPLLENNNDIQRLIYFGIGLSATVLLIISAGIFSPGLTYLMVQSTFGKTTSEENPFLKFLNCPFSRQNSSFYLFTVILQYLIPIFMLIPLFFFILCCCKRKRFRSYKFTNEYKKEYKKDFNSFLRHISQELRRRESSLEKGEDEEIVKLRKSEAEINNVKKQLWVFSEQVKLDTSLTSVKNYESKSSNPNGFFLNFVNQYIVKGIKKFLSQKFKKIIKFIDSKYPTKRKVMFVFVDNLYAFCLVFIFTCFYNSLPKLSNDLISFFLYLKNGEDSYMMFRPRVNIKEALYEPYITAFYVFCLMGVLGYILMIFLITFLSPSFSNPDLAHHLPIHVAKSNLNSFLLHFKKVCHEKLKKFQEIPKLTHENQVLKELNIMIPEYDKKIREFKKDEALKENKCIREKNWFQNVFDEIGDYLSYIFKTSNYFMWYYDEISIIIDNKEDHLHTLKQDLNNLKQKSEEIEKKDKIIKSLSKKINEKQKEFEELRNDNEYFFVLKNHVDDFKISIIKDKIYEYINKYYHDYQRYHLFQVFCNILSLNYKSTIPYFISIEMILLFIVSLSKNLGLYVTIQAGQSFKVAQAFMLVPTFLYVLAVYIFNPYKEDYNGELMYITLITFLVCFSLNQLDGLYRISCYLVYFIIVLYFLLLILVLSFKKHIDSIRNFVASSFIKKDIYLMSKVLFNRKTNLEPKKIQINCKFKCTSCTNDCTSSCNTRKTYLRMISQYCNNINNEKGAPKSEDYKLLIIFIISWAIFKLKRYKVVSLVVLLAFLVNLIWLPMILLFVLPLLILLFVIKCMMGTSNQLNEPLLQNDDPLINKCSYEILENEKLIPINVKFCLENAEVGKGISKGLIVFMLDIHENSADWREYEDAYVISISTQGKKGKVFKVNYMELDLIYEFEGSYPAIKNIVKSIYNNYTDHKKEKVRNQSKYISAIHDTLAMILEKLNGTESNNIFYKSMNCHLLYSLIIYYDNMLQQLQKNDNDNLVKEIVEYHNIPDNGKSEVHKGVTKLTNSLFLKKLNPSLRTKFLKALKENLDEQLQKLFHADFSFDEDENTNMLFSDVLSRNSFFINENELLVRRAGIPTKFIGAFNSFKNVLVNHNGTSYIKCFKEQCGILFENMFYLSLSDYKFKCTRYKYLEFEYDHQLVRDFEDRQVRRDEIKTNSAILCPGLYSPSGELVCRPLVFCRIEKRKIDE